MLQRSSELDGKIVWADLARKGRYAVRQFPKNTGDGNKGFMGLENGTQEHDVVPVCIYHLSIS